MWSMWAPRRLGVNASEPIEEGVEIPSVHDCVCSRPDSGTPKKECLDLSVGVLNGMSSTSDRDEIPDLLMRLGLSSALRASFRAVS